MVPDKLVIGVNPAVHLTANGTLGKRMTMGKCRGDDRCHSLMRHRRLGSTLKVSLLPPTMGSLSSLTCLIALARGTNLQASLADSAILAAIALAPVATDTNGKHRAAAWLHARARPKTFDMIVGCPHPINIQRCRDDCHAIRALRSRMMMCAYGAMRLLPPAE